jgi:hypothetical protein
MIRIRAQALRAALKASFDQVEAGVDPFLDGYSVWGDYIRPGRLIWGSHARRASCHGLRGAADVSVAIAGRVAERPAQRGALRVAARVLSRALGLIVVVGVDEALVRLSSAFTGTISALRSLPRSTRSASRP